MKKLLAFVIAVCASLVFCLKTYAVTLPYLYVTSNNYKEGDKIDRNKDVIYVPKTKSIQLYAIIVHGNDLLDPVIGSDSLGVFADEVNLKNVTWQSSNESIATVDSKGKVTGVATGRVTITATYGDETETYKINVVSINSDLWSIEEFILSTGLDIQEIQLEHMKGGEDYFIAIADEYDCNVPGFQETLTCNVYKISLDGTVTKTNEYGTSLKEYTRYTMELDESANKLIIHIINYGGTSIPGALLNDEILVRELSDEKYIDLHCVDYENQSVDMCEFAIEKNNKTLYGIIDSSGKIILQPNEKYEPVFDDENNNSNFAALEDEEYYYIAAQNGKLEKIKKSLLSGLGIDIEDICVENSETDINYYSYIGTPCPEGQICEQVIQQVFFTKDKVLARVYDAASYYLKVVNNTPYLVGAYAKDCDTGDNCFTTFYNIYKPSALTNPIVKDAKSPIFGVTTFSYIKDKKFYVTDLANQILEMGFYDTSDYYHLLYEGEDLNLYEHSYYDNETPGGATRKEYFILKPVKTSNPDNPDNPDKPSTKYSCQKVDGKFYDKNGKEVSKNEYENSCPEPPAYTGIAIPIIAIGLLGTGFAIVNKKKHILNKI